MKTSPATIFFVFLTCCGAYWMSMIFISKNLFHTSIEEEQKSWQVWKKIWAWPSIILTAIGLYKLIVSM